MFYLTEQIRKRRLGNYRTLLAIQHNPYSKNPKELIKSFEPEELRNRSDEFNASSFENFKNSLDSRSAIKVK